MCLLLWGPCLWAADTGWYLGVGQVLHRAINFQAVDIQGNQYHLEDAHGKTQSNLESTDPVMELGYIKEDGICAAFQSSSSSKRRLTLVPNAAGQSPVEVEMKEIRLAMIVELPFTRGDVFTGGLSVIGENVTTHSDASPLEFGSSALTHVGFYSDVGIFMVLRFGKQFFLKSNFYFPVLTADQVWLGGQNTEMHRASLTLNYLF